MPAASVALFTGLFVIPDPVIGSLVLLVLGLPVELLLEAGMSGDGGARGLLPVRGAPSEFAPEMSTLSLVLPVLVVPIAVPALLGLVTSS